MKDLDLHISEYKDHIQRLKSDPIYREEFLKQKEANLQKWWNNLKPFKDEQYVPDLPIPLTDFYINRLIDLGAIPLSELEDNTWYYGNYRNSKFGRWDADEHVFHHLRFKWGSHRWDTAKHFQHDDGFALFVPLRTATINEIESVLENII